MITVVNVRTASPRNGEIIYCGRGCAGHAPSVLGNPFAITKTVSRELAIAQYKRWLWTHMQDHSDPVYVELVEIACKLCAGDSVQLACHCAPQACHCDVIVAAVTWIIRQF